MIVFVPTAGAATFTVTNTSDAVAPPAGSLRQAITNALAGGDASDTIAFAQGVAGTIQLAGPLPNMASTTLTIIGPGADQLTVRGQAPATPYSVFTMCGDDASDGANVTIAGLTITNGGGTANIVPPVGSTVGGGIFARAFNTCRLTLNGVAVSGNSATSASNGTTAATALGGGVYTGPGVQLTLLHSTVSGNTATASVSAGNNPATAQGGGIWTAADGTVTIDNSTVSGNSATATLTPASTGAAGTRGGGLMVGGGAIRSATITANSVSATGGLTPQALGANLAGPVTTAQGAPVPTYRNTIFSAGAGASNCTGSIQDGVPFPLVSLGNNISSDGSCFLDLTTDFPNTDPLIGALAANGGPTQTHLPQAGSPAIDQGFSDGLTNDQRGLPRPVQQDPVQDPVPIVTPGSVNPAGGDGADIGAVEVARPPDPDEPPLLRKIHYSLRFKYVDKHGRNFVTARVFCHSIVCVLAGSGRVRILPFTPDDGKRSLGAQTYELEPTTGTFEFTKGRQVAGTLRFKVPNRTARAVKRAILAGARGKVRGDINVDGVNTFQPDLNKRRFRDIKLFARSRGGAKG